MHPVWRKRNDWNLGARRRHPLYGPSQQWRRNLPRRCIWRRAHADRQAFRQPCVFMASFPPRWAALCVLRVERRAEKARWRLCRFARLERNQPGDSHGAYSNGIRGRHLLYAREGSIVAQSFDVKTLKISGEPIRVVERSTYFDKTGWSGFSVSNNGVLAYVPEIPPMRLMWVDRAGREAGQIGPLGLWGSLRISADGRRLALQHM